MATSDDYEGIRRVLAEYCFATDAGDTERWAGTFTDDIAWLGGAFGEFRGKEAAIAYHGGSGGASKKFRHLTHNALIDIDGDKATSQSYIQVWDQSEAQPKLMFSGMYDDKLVKQNGRWLIKERRILSHPSELSAR